MTERLTPLSPGRFSRTQLALFAGGSGDHNPIHIDVDAARANGFDDVIVPGMLLMAQLGRVLTDWAGPSSVRRWSVRFTSITPVLTTPTCFAEVLEEVQYAGEACLRVALWVNVEGIGEVVRGEAIVAKNDDP
ncbi:MAG TPA: MaoC/PaaZ C-terminal domain-containing protein [Steroidobacter sp.]|uniref:MaoC/PaaZ C-terminal domain-containing protein n=1 Tax=Steroidobacter sp. TaxID=1978227 RepID=UPI002ED995BE